ncbi:rhodanese-like domain-containing protein [Flavobacterium agricola]|uniref:Rhodanese-like domain-containing protein n=1 Tax=Flavobacterium agricola TaxID=2870839 RepID=A0ABY6LZ55_9FLAO|nr:rhodanese-like domain-containing protein [Flavobacterium agricola]UYW01608.1 rhodanese-like domain-containing protein [Flavobacterium agricola]
MNISQTEWWEKAQADADGVIVDVRTPDEFASGFIPGAVNVNFYEQEAFLNFVESLDKTKNYYVYCRSGARSGNSCAIMNEMGIENAYNLSGGILEWQGPLA